jgi:hypothetical protein
MGAYRAAIPAGPVATDQPGHRSSLCGRAKTGHHSPRNAHTAQLACPDYQWRVL